MDSTNNRTEQVERSDEISSELVRVAAQLISELHPQRQGGAALHLDSAFERDLIEYMDSAHPEFGQSIRENPKAKLSKEKTQQLDGYIKEFKQGRKY